MSLASGSRKKLLGYYGVPEQSIPQSQVAHSSPFLFEVSNKTTPELGTGENHQIELPTYEQAILSEIPCTDSKPEGHLSKCWQLYFVCAVSLILFAGIFAGIMVVAIRQRDPVIGGERGQPLQK